MKKAVAIPYVISLILGVIVVAVLAYWFISSGGKGGSVGNEAECNARKLEFCTTQTEENWQKMLVVCGGKRFKVIEDDPTTPQNEADNQCYSFCRTIIPGWTIIPTNTHPECKAK